MKIGIDATSLCRKLTGIESYTLNLVKALLEQPHDEEFIVLFRRKIHPELLPLQKEAKFLISPFKSQFFTEQVWLPYKTRRLNLDIVHFPAFPPGLVKLKKFILTSFDAAVWKYSHTLSWKGRFYWKPLTCLALKQARQVLTISESSKKDIAEFSGISPDRITNTGIAVSEKFKSVNDVSALDQTRDIFSLPDKFILSVCSLEPRKNLTGLLSAFQIFRQNNPAFAHKLFLVGRAAWGRKKIERKIIELGLVDEVELLGYVPICDLVNIYNLAELFVFPSFYEGFGLPLLEAMACGVPTITSRVDCLVETAGNASILVDPYDVMEIAGAIEILLGNNVQQDKLRKLGFERAKKFYWIDVASKVREVYHK